MQVLNLENLLQSKKSMIFDIQQTKRIWAQSMIMDIPMFILLGIILILQIRKYISKPPRSRKR